MKTRALRNLSNCLRTLLIAAAFAPAVTFGSVDGGGSTGGGDASSSDIRVIAKMFADKEAVKTNLATILTTFNRFEASGQVPQQLKLLISEGLIEDVKAARYDLKPYCEDSNHVERSASTLLTDIRRTPGAPSPVICINARRLAQEKATFQQIMGLLVHEHARHFGLEDKDSLDMNPIGDWVAESYNEIDERVSWVRVGDSFMSTHMSQSGGYPFVKIEIHSQTGTHKFVVDDTDKCVADIVTTDNYGRPYKKNLSNGMSLEFMDRYDTERGYFGDIKVHKFTQLFIRDNFGISARSSVCNLTYRIVVDGVSSEQIKINGIANYSISTKSLIYPLTIIANTTPTIWKDLQ